jgi:NAD(P)-dependent dehydrogenase (short-subunit alcohol dehydrogenase family)
MDDLSQPPATTRYDLTGKVTLIPGGLGGAGQAVTRAFLESGAEVVAVGRADRKGGESFLAQLGDLAAKLTIRQANVMDEPEVEGLIQSVTQQHHRLDVLINLVGGYNAGQPVTDLDLGTWEGMLDLNLRAAFLLSKHAGRAMISQEWGAIIHVSSRAAREGRRNAAAYAVAKNAVLTLAEIQAEELRDANITVNTLLPSIIDTPANRASMPRANFGRWPKPEEIARVLLFLASSDARLISGAAIPVYGRA